jgi:Carboxypeptidase regulatory-like domain
MFLSRSLGKVFGVGVLGLLTFSAAFAQSERGTITGAVRDASGSVIPAANVTITNSATGVKLETSTNATGEFAEPNLQPGVYTVRVEKAGFRTTEVTGLTVDAAVTVRADATLQIGTSTEAIEVQATAVQLQTEDSKNSVTLQNKLVDDLPLVVSGTVRTPFDLASLTPDAKNLGGDNGFSVGGGQVAAYGTSLDGVSTNTSRALSKSWVASNSPSVEAIEQFTVDTNGYKAEYGHAGGGNLTYASKSGTAQYHGSVYEFLRNNDFDANNFFNNASRIPISIYKQNDFGAAVGGPIWIPKLVHRDSHKNFFFFSYEGFRNRTGANGTTFTVPTPEMYQGNFSNWVTAAGVQIPIYNPTTQVTSANGTVTRQVFPGNIVPQSLWSPAAKQALSVFQSGGMLNPNNGAAPGTAAYITNNFLETSGTQIYPVNKLSLKGDRIFNEKHRLSGYWGHDREHQTYGADGPPTLPGLYSNYNDLTQGTDVFRMSWDWTFSPTKLNHFYAGGNNWVQDHKPPQEYIGNWKSKFCLGNVPNCNENLVNLFSGGTGDTYSTWGGQADNGSENTVYSYNDDFTWVHGNHTFKFGGQYQLNHYNGFGRQCEAGCVGFSYQETGVPGGSNPNAGGNAFASFLLGYADSGQIDTVRFIGQQFYYFGGYFQDDWRISQKLVLNLGVRWDGNLSPTGLNDRWSNFSPTTPNPAAGGILGASVFAGDCSGCVGNRRLTPMWPWGFGPHISFAYSKDAKTVIRGAYARSYGALVSVSGSTHQQGFTLTYSPTNATSGITPTFILDQGFPSYVVPPFINPSVANISNGASAVSWFQGEETTKLPAYDNFNLSIQRQLGNSMFIEAQYSGVMGEHLQTELLDYNQINPSYLTAFGTVAQSITVLNSQIGSAAGIASGVKAPYPGFTGTVAQALRPFPQYNVIDTYAGQGDHSGHSTYHAAILKFQKRYSNGLVLQTSYVFSKLLTDSDSAWGTAYAADQFNRGLEKSIGEYDVTHDFKFSAVYDLPFGKGQKYLTSGPGAWILGNWRISSINLYSSGIPVSISTSLTLPIYAPGDSGATRVPPYITSYTGWQPSYSGKFNPQVDNFFVPYGTGPFPIQGSGTALNSIGNDTRFNPKLRLFPNLTENMSLTKTFPIHESIRMEFRAEAFNVFNRVRFGTGSTQLQSQSFGVLTGAGSQINSPRALQLALKLYF